MKQKFSSLSPPVLMATLFVAMLAIFAAIPGQVLALEGFTGFGSFSTARSGHTATVLAGDKVLLTGGGTSLSELFTPGAAKEWTSPAGLSTKALADSTATLLESGSALIAGGADAYGALTDSFLCNATSCDPTTPLSSVRQAHTATRLPDGRVVVIGGYDGSYLNSAAIYAPGATPTWITKGGLKTARAWHTATLLTSGLNAGKIVVTGGFNDADGYLVSAELYDPATGASTLLPDMCSSTPCVAADARANHTATLLPSGRILVFGGMNETGSVLLAAPYALAGTTLYNTPVPLKTGYVLTITDGATTSTYAWNALAPAADAFADHQATMLTNGKVLISGGFGSLDYDQTVDDWFENATSKVLLCDDGTPVACSDPGYPLGAARQLHTASLRESDGKVIIAGGNQRSGAAPGPFVLNDLKTTELYTPTQSLNITISGDGAGTVKVAGYTPAGDCVKTAGDTPQACTNLYDSSSTALALSAVPESTTPPSVFYEWKTACSGTDQNACSVTPNKTRNVEAVIYRATHDLVLTINNGLRAAGTVTVNGTPKTATETISLSSLLTNVKLVATTDANTKFDGWVAGTANTCENTGGVISETNIAGDTCTIPSMLAAHAVTAKFSPIEFSLKISFAGNAKNWHADKVLKVVSDTGTSASVTAISRDFDSTASVFEQQINKADTVVLSALTDPAKDDCNKFQGWSINNGSETATNPVTLTTGIENTVVARFRPLRNNLTVNKLGTGTGTVAVVSTPDSSKSSDGITNTTVTNYPTAIPNLTKCSAAAGTVLTPTADTGSTFDGWGTSCSDAGGSVLGNTCVIGSMDAAKNVTANFKQNLVTPVITITGTNVKGTPATSTDGIYQVKWTAISGATYKIESKVGLNGTYSTRATGQTTNSFSETIGDDGNPSGGNDFYYKITAEKEGYVTSSSEAKINVDLKLIFAGTTTVPAAITIAPGSVDNGGVNNTGRFSISWPRTQVTGVTYQVDCSDGTRSVTYPKAGEAEITGNSKLIDLTSVMALGSHTFTIKVTALKAGFSNVPLEKTIIVEPKLILGDLGALTVPSTTSTTPNKTGKFNISWKVANVSSGTTYAVKVYKDGSTTALPFDIKLTPSLTDPGTTANLSTSIDVVTALNGTLLKYGNGYYQFTLSAANKDTAGNNLYAPAAESGPSARVYVSLGLTTPTNIKVSSSTSSTGKFTVSWGATNVPGSSYVLQMKKNSGSWIEVYRGTSLFRSMSVLPSTTAATYSFRVSAVKPYYAPSTLSSVVAVTVAKP